MSEPVVIVTVRGGIAEAWAVGEDVKIIHIDWDEFDDGNIPETDWVLDTIEKIQRVPYTKDRESLFEDLLYELGDLVDYEPQADAEIRQAMREAGHPIPETRDRQEVLPLR